MNQEPSLSRLSLEESLDDIEQLKNAAQAEGLDNPEDLTSIEEVQAMEELLQETGAYTPIIAVAKNKNSSPELNVEPSEPKNEDQQKELDYENYKNWYEKMGEIYNKSFQDYIYGSKIPHEPGEEKVEINGESFNFQYEDLRSEIKDPLNSKLDLEKGLLQQFYQKVYIRGKYNGEYKEIIRQNIPVEEKYSWENISLVLDRGADNHFVFQYLLNGQLEVEFKYETENDDSKKSFNTNNKLVYPAITKNIYWDKSRTGVYKTFSADTPLGFVDRNFLMWCPGEPIPTLSDSADTESIRKLAVEYGDNLTPEAMKIQKNLSAEKIVEISDFNIYQHNWARFIESEPIGSHSFHPQTMGHEESFSNPAISLKLSSPWVDGEQNEEKIFTISELSQEELEEKAHELAHKLIDDNYFVLSQFKREELKIAFVKEIMEQMPKFTESEEMWIIDPRIYIYAKSLRDRFSKVSYGKTIIKTFNGLEVRSVISTIDAQRMNLEGSPAEGIIPVWWENVVKEASSRKEITMETKTEIRAAYKDKDVFTVTLLRDSFSNINYNYSKKVDDADVNILMPVNIYEISSWIDDDGGRMKEEKLIGQENRDVKKRCEIPETIASIFENESSALLKVLIKGDGPYPKIILCTPTKYEEFNQIENNIIQEKEENLSKILEDGKELMESAVEFFPPEIFEKMPEANIEPEYRIYGAPILDEDEKVVWKQFMRHYPDPETHPQTWVLVSRKGYRSKSIGSTLEELVNEYYQGNYNRETIEETLKSLKNVIQPKITPMENSKLIKYLILIQDYELSKRRGR
jgi:hypothetical protein